MIRIEKHLPAPHGVANALTAAAPKLLLAFSERSRSRLRTTLSSGIEAAIILPRGTVLRGGDVLMADDGSMVAVESAPEHVLVVSAGAGLVLMRAAYHLGNRHIPVEIGEKYLKIGYDPVLLDMLQRLGTEVVEQQSPFEPEAGAYGGGHRHGHDATFDEDYALAQASYTRHSDMAAGEAGAPRQGHAASGGGHEAGAVHSHAHAHAHAHPEEHESFRPDLLPHWTPEE